MERSLLNPIYNNTLKSQTPTTKPTNEYKTTKRVNLQEELYSEAQVPEVTYDVADVVREGSYSVVNKRGTDSNSDGYNVLVHNGDQFNQPPTHLPQEGYSKLQL